MPRWAPGARDRLERAALELFDEQGYEQTTIVEIADRAGLKERSYYRHFPDKREVLFAGGEDLEQRLVAEIETMPTPLAPLDTLLAALPAAGDVLRPRDFVRRRQQVIATSRALGERELIKLAGLSEAMSAALAARGADRQTAELCVGIGMTVMRQATQRWVDAADAEYAHLVRDTTRSLLHLLEASSQGPA